MKVLFAIVAALVFLPLLFIIWLFVAVEWRRAIREWKELD
jgi:hypothetical protein